MRTAMGWAPNQQVKWPMVVWWSDDSEHYIGECQKCEAESAITCDRWAARRWCLEHKCKGAK